MPEDVPQGDRLTSARLLLPFLICSPARSVVRTLFPSCCRTCGLRGRLYASGLQPFYLNKTKSCHKPQAARALAGLRGGVALPLCECLGALGTSLCLQASLDAVPQKRKTRIICSPAGFIAHRTTFIKLAAVKACQDFPGSHAMGTEAQHT